MSDFYKRQEPIIDDINKAFLTSPEVFLDNNIKNFGFTQYKQKISIPTSLVRRGTRKIH